MLNADSHLYIVGPRAVICNSLSCRPVFMQEARAVSVAWTNERAEAHTVINILSMSWVFCGLRKWKERTCVCKLVNCILHVSYCLDMSFLYKFKKKLKTMSWVVAYHEAVEHQPCGKLGRIIKYNHDWPHTTVLGYLFYSLRYVI